MQSGQGSLVPELVATSLEISTTNPAATLITSLSTVFANDSAVTIQWTYNGGPAGYGYPNSFIIEAAAGAYNLDFLEIG